MTWIGAVLFCRWLSDETGKTFRSPSEAEWELAARGPEGRRWPWGDDEAIPPTQPPQGVHDMLAHIIGEWCANKYVEHPSPEQLTDTGVDEGDDHSRRVVRGYYHCHYPHGGRLLRLTEYGWRNHLGRPWTRVDCDPVAAATEEALYGFRVVEQVRQRYGKQQ